MRGSSTVAPARSGVEVTTSSESIADGMAASATDVPSSRQVYVLASRSFGSPSATVALHCGSRSTSSVRQPASATQAARLTAVVVFPTPPF